MRGVNFLEAGVASYGPAANLWEEVMRQEGRRRRRVGVKEGRM